MNDLHDLIPVDKHDLGRAQAAVDAGYPAVEPILGPLMEWLQDGNWPVARVLTPFLQSIGAPLAPHIWRVLRSNDRVWQYWVIGLLIPALPIETAVAFRKELERIRYTPLPDERGERLDERASEVMTHFDWGREHA